MGQWSHLYARRDWRIARAEYLRKHPLCVMCQSIGRVTAANVVDHVAPHKGNMLLFWSKANWQGLCAHHHNSTKHHHEATPNVGCDEHGNPHAPNHAWRSA
jgi:5-methylcytosine-specific restriction enzyme A